MLESGTLIADKYRVERELGRGGMGFVVQALHERLGERVAVKLMIPELSRHPEAVTRFLREARSAFRIQSEHVARVLDVGEHEGTPFTVIELLAGSDLSQELQRRGRFPLDEAIEITLQICSALAAAHKLGIVHRDLKPSNLFLTQRPDGSRLIKVLDFGISKALDDPDASADGSLTLSHRLLGSPHYMSPEQARTPRQVDGRSDIWSLGVVFYELLSGQRPFRGDTPFAVLASLLSDSVAELRERPELPADAFAVIERCLQRAPSERYPNIGEFAAALVTVAEAHRSPSAAYSDFTRQWWRSAPSHSAVTSSVAAPSADHTLRSAGNTENPYSVSTAPRSLRADNPPSRRGSKLLLLVAAPLVVAVAWFAAWSEPTPPPHGAHPGASDTKGAGESAALTGSDSGASMQATPPNSASAVAPSTAAEPPVIQAPSAQPADDAPRAMSQRTAPSNSAARAKASPPVAKPSEPAPLPRPRTTSDPTGTPE